VALCLTRNGSAEYNWLEVPLIGDDDVSAKFLPLRNLRVYTYRVI
jgi:hypothetical protein